MRHFATVPADLPAAGPADGARMRRRGQGLKLFSVVELVHNDGPWTVPERLRKLNGVLTLSGGKRAEGWSTSLMAYDAKWDSTDQLPQR